MITTQLNENFPEYDLNSQHIFWNGKDTGKQIVIQNDEPVAIFSDMYRLIPLQEAEKIADEAAERTGFVPLSDLPSDISRRLDSKYHRSAYNKERTAMIKFFVNPKPFNVAPLGKPEDNIYLGSFTKDSINGWSAFGAGTFTLRSVCGNMMAHFSKAGNFELESNQLHLLNTKTAQMIKSVYQRHTKEYNFDELLEMVVKVGEAGEPIIKRYREMQFEEITTFEAKKIAKMQKSVTSELTWLDVDKLGNVKISRPTTRWDAMNDITQVVSHTEKIGFEGKMSIMATVDRVLVR